jgi:type II secretory pathway component PulK
MYTNKKGVSNSLIAVLIVVALMVVIVATIVVVDGTQKVNEKATVTSVQAQSSGLIQLNVNKPAHRTTGATAMLTLDLE